MTEKDAGILKKGPWGFYKTLKEGFHSVYENLEDAPTTSTTNATTTSTTTTSTGAAAEEEDPEVAEYNKSASEATEKAKALTKSLQDKTQVAAEKAYETAENNANTVAGSQAQSILNADKSNGKEKYKVNDEWNSITNKITKDYSEIVDLVNQFEKGNAKQNFKLTVKIMKAVVRFSINFISLLDASSHPNFIDAAGSAFGQLFYLIGNEIDNKDENHYQDYVLAILYFFFSIGMAYYASENLAYNLLYTNAKHIVENTPHEILESCKNSPSYFAKPIFYFYYHLFLPVILLDNAITFTRSFLAPHVTTYVGFMGVLRILLFFIVFLVCQYFSYLTQNAIYEGIVFAVGIVGLCILLWRWGIFDTILGLEVILKIIWFIIVFVLLFMILFAYSKISKIFVFIYLLYISFFYISQNENISLYKVYWDLQMTKEMNFYYNNLYNDYIMDNESIYNVSKFLFNNWFLISLLFIIFSFWLVLVKDQTTMANFLNPFVFAVLSLIGWILFIKLTKYLQTDINQTTVYQNEFSWFSWQSWIDLITPSAPKVLAELNDQKTNPENPFDILIQGIQKYLLSIFENKSD